MHARVNYLSTPDVILPRVQFYALGEHTLYPYIGFLTLKSDFCQIGVFKVSVGVIGFSVLNRETPDQIGRVGKHDQPHIQIFLRIFNKYQIDKSSMDLNQWIFGCYSL